MILLDCTFLGGFLRCQRGQGPEGLPSLCALMHCMTGSWGIGHTTGLQMQGGGGGSIGGIGGGTTLVFSHDGVSSGTTNTRPDLDLQYLVATNVAVIPRNKAAKIITSTIVHVTSTAAIHFK